MLLVMSMYQQSETAISNNGKSYLDRYFLRVGEIFGNDAITLEGAPASHHEKYQQPQSLLPPAMAPAGIDNEVEVKKRQTGK